MKIAFTVEGLSDEIVVPIFVRRILNSEIEPVFRARRSGGVQAVLKTLHGIAWEFWQTDVLGLVVTIDNDERLPLHDLTHSTFNRVSNCNYCELQSLLPQLPDRTPNPPFRFAVGVAVQALESWLLADGHLAGLPESFHPKKLKRDLYGTEYPTKVHFEKFAKPKAEQIDFNLLRQNCPSFVHFENSVKALAS